MRRSAERFRVVPFRNPSGQIVFRVSGRKIDGSRVRENYLEEGQAVGRKQELEVAALNMPITVSLKTTRLTDPQLADAEAAVQRLKGTPHTLSFAVDYLLRNWRPPTVDRTVQEAFNEFIAAKAAKNLRQRTLADLRSRTGELVDKHAKQPVSEIKIEHVKDLLHKPGRHPLTANNDRRVLYSFFKWCLKHGYCESNPVEKIEPAEVEQQEPVILSLMEVRALLGAALGYKKGVLVPYISLGLFGGLRPTELSRIDWGVVNLSQKLVRVGAHVAKLRQRRIVELPENLLPWLLPHQTKPIVGPNWRRDFDAVRRLAGFRGSSRKKKDDQARKEWPGDVLRHTALSYRLAWCKNEEETASWAGNSPETLHRFYKGLVAPEDARNYWQLTPDNINAQIIPMPAVA